MTAPPSTDAATPNELWYLTALRQLTAHFGRPPGITELAFYCQRTRSPVWEALIRLEAKGYVERNDDRRFVIVRGAK